MFSLVEPRSHLTCSPVATVEEIGDENQNLENLDIEISWGLLLTVLTSKLFA